MRAVVSASQLISATPSSAYFSLLYCGSPQAVGKSLLQHLEPASSHVPTLVITGLLLIPVLFHHSSLVSKSFALSYVGPGWLQGLQWAAVGLLELAGTDWGWHGAAPALPHAATPQLPATTWAPPGPSTHHQGGQLQGCGREIWGTSPMAMLQAQVLLCTMKWSCNLNQWTLCYNQTLWSTMPTFCLRLYNAEFCYLCYLNRELGGESSLLKWSNILPCAKGGLNPSTFNPEENTCQDVAWSSD